MEIRKIGRDGLQEVSDFIRPLFIGTYTDLVANGKVSVPLIFEHWNTVVPLRRKFDSGVEYYMFAEDGKDAALVALDVEQDGVLYLDKLYVAEEFQGRGYGTRAMEFAIDYGRDHGCDIITTHSNAGNERAIRHYGRFGMKVAETVHRVHDEGEYDYAYLVGRIR